MIGDGQARLEALERRLIDEIERTEGIAAPWMRGAAVEGLYDVVVCGGGLSGLSAAFGLKRRGLANVMVIDQNEPGREGPWVTCARMKTLRSPKHLAGPDLGIPSLTMRSWYEAVHGEDAWAQLDKIPRQDWMDYLVWFRRVAGIKVANGTRLSGITPSEEGLELSIETAQGQTKIRTRRLVLATGIDGCGGPDIPALVNGLPKSRWTHSSEAGDDSHLGGKDILIVGGSTAGFDWAVTANENAARSVTMLARADGFPSTEVLAWTNFPGFLGHFVDLPDATRWRFMRRFFDLKSPPTQDQYDRAMAAPNFKLVTGCPTLELRMAGDRVEAVTPQGVFAGDHVLLGTGYTFDLSMRPELASLTGHFALWGDRFEPSSDEADPFIAGHPYLGTGFELQPKQPEDAWVSRIHVFNNGAIPSLGPICNGVTGLKYGVPRIVSGLVKSLFIEDAGAHYDHFSTFGAVHFDPRPPHERAALEEATP